MDTLCEDYDHILAVASWVILKSLDLFLYYIQPASNANFEHEHMPHKEYFACQ